MSARCCHVVGDGLGPVGCGVGTLCQLACPSRRPSSSPPRSRWVVVGRSRTIRRSHALGCGEGCLMTRARPPPTNASKRQRPLRPRALVFCLCLARLSVLLERAGSLSAESVLAVRGACPVPGGGWGSVGRVVVADGYRRAPRLLRSVYACARGLAHVTTHGRLAPAAFKRRVNFSL